MPVNIKGWMFHSSKFCFCIPVRAGFVLMSILTFLLSGAISIIIWFEIFHSYELTTKEHVAFVLTGVFESLLFFVSIIGFIGVVARKQLFVMIYTYFIYVHFVLNLAVGIFFLVTVRASNRQQLVDYCAEMFVNTSIEPKCSDLINISTYVFIAIVGALLLFELYGVLIATRYVYRLRKQKHDDRSRRLGFYHALSTPETPSTGHAGRASDNIELLSSRDGAGDTRDLEDVLDIRPQSYMPLVTYERDLPPVPAPSTPSSGRRIRALPPRPTTAPLFLETSTRSQKKSEKLPNPYESASHTSRRYEPTSSDSEDDVRTAEVSTAAHFALVDHANYMGSIFTNAPPVVMTNNAKQDSRSRTDLLRGGLGRGIDDMQKRHDVQRQHAIDSLDNLIFQLYTLSFFLSPALLPLLCRIATQFAFYKPRELDPKLSLRVWFLFLCASNAPSFWFHLRDGATEGRAVILDFVGMGYSPSKLHLVLLDTLILCLQMLLTTISFEISLRLSSLSGEAGAIPPLSSLSSAPTPALETDSRDGDDDQKHSHQTPAMIIDLRFHHLMSRLRNSTPLVPRADLPTLPLPNTTPTPLSMHLRAIIRRRDEARRRTLDHPEPAEFISNSPSTQDVGRIPGSMTTQQIE